MVINPSFQQGLQQQPPAPIPPVNQQTNYQVRPQQFNQQFTQPPLPQVSPLLTPPQPFNPQVPPPYFPQYPPFNSPSVGSSDSSILVGLVPQLASQCTPCIRQTLKLHNSFKMGKGRMHNPISHNCAIVHVIHL